MQDDLTLSERDYPGLYQATDEESNRAQRSHFRTLLLFLLLLLLGTIVSLFAGASRVYAVSAAVVFLGSLTFSIYMALKRNDRTWYSARAVAESVKTRAWRFMMRAEPYQGAIDDPEARKLFLADLEEILKENRQVTQELCDESSSYDAISKNMERIRSLEVPERLQFYIRHRVNEQLAWYRGKARKSKGQRTSWFAVIVLLNSLAAACAVLRIIYITWTFLPTQVLATSAASAISWLQAKRFGELSTSYALAAHEIAIIKERWKGITGENELSQFVGDAENAFSREHTQWAARRDARQ